MINVNGNFRKDQDHDKVLFFISSNFPFRTLSDVLINKLANSFLSELPSAIS